MRASACILILAAIGHAAPDDSRLQETWKSIRRAFRWIESQQDKDTGLFPSERGRADTIAGTALVLDGLIECGATRNGHRDFPVAARVLHKGMHGLAKAQLESGRYVPGKGTTTYPDVLACKVLVRERLVPDPRLNKYVVRASSALKEAQKRDGSWAFRAGAEGDPILTSLSARVFYIARSKPPYQGVARAGPYLSAIFDRDPLEIALPREPGPAALVLPKSNAGRLAAALDGLLHLNPEVGIEVDERLRQTWLADHPLGKERDDPVHAYWVVRRIVHRRRVGYERWLRTLRDALVASQQAGGSWRFPGLEEIPSTALALWCLGHPLWQVSRWGILSPPRPPG